MRLLALCNRGNSISLHKDSKRHHALPRVSTDICIMVGKSRGQPSNLSVTATRLQVFILMAILLLLSVYVFGVSIYVYF